jgi:prolyl-tRNA synthetase
VQSYKQLPLNLYQIQTKFRDEIRPRFGLLRGREFVMKDAYSFDVSKEAALESYEQMRVAYNKIFTAFGLDYRMVAADSGDIGGDYSHEFHVLAKTGEDELIFDPEGDYAVNVEKYDSATAPKPRDQLDTKRGIEIGHIFYLGTTYSAPMEANIQVDGKLQPVHMGCYGIGVSRLIGAAIEQNNDENGIIWPRAIAPYDVHLLNLRPNDAECTAAVEAEKASLESQGLEVLVDDTDDSVGAKFSKADLIGVPFQCAIGPKGVKAGMAEWKNRATGEKVERKLGAKFEG